MLWASGCFRCWDGDATVQPRPFLCVLFCEYLFLTTPVPFTMKLLFLLFFFFFSKLHFLENFQVSNTAWESVSKCRTEWKIQRVLNPSTRTAFPTLILFLAFPLLGAFHYWLSENHIHFFSYHLKIPFFFKQDYLLLVFSLHKA